MLNTARNRPALLIGVAITLILAAMFIRSFFKKPAVQSAFYEVKRSDFLVTIVEGGNLEAVNEVIVRNEVEGREARVIYIVPEGSYVKKDDLLVELDTGEVVERLNQQQLSYDKAEAALVQAQENLEIQKSVIASQKDAAALNVRFAIIDLEKYEKADRAKLVLAEEIKITTTTSDLLLAQDKLDWSQKLFEKGFESKNNVDSDKNRLLDLTLQLKMAETNLWALKQFDNKKQFERLSADLEEAKKEEARVIAQGESKLSQLRADLITQSNSVKLTGEKLATDKLMLKKSKIYAPQDGLVVYAEMQSRFSSQSMIEEGAMVRNQQTLIKLPDTSEMKVTVKVHESHVAKVRPGLPAFVVLDPLPDQRFKAQVTKVGVLPNTQDRFGNPNLKVYDTVVKIQDALPGVKPGVSARAEIIITNVPNALTVPIQAITSLKGETVAYVRKGSGSVPTVVVVGMFNTKFIEVVSGLSEGDQILLSPPYDAEQKDLGGSIIRKEEKVDPDALRSSMPEVETPQRRQPQREAAADGGQPGGEGQRGGAGFNREQMMKQYDTNGDGQLDETERAAIQQQFGGRGGRGGGGTGGGGRRGNGEGRGGQGGVRQPQGNPQE